MTPRLQVGFFSYPRLVHGGGFEAYLIELANALSARGHTVQVITADRFQYGLLQRALNVYYRNPIGYDNSRVSDAELRASLIGPELHEVPLQRMAARMRSCDVVYAKNEILDLSVLRLLRLKRLPPVVAGIHTPMWYARAPSRHARLHNRLYLGRLYRRLLGGVSAVHCSNSHDRELFPRVLRFPSERVYHVPYPFDAAPAPVPADVSAERLRVVFAGRLTEQKGIDVLLRAIELLAAGEDAGEFAFTIAGSGQPDLEQAVRDVAGRYANVTYVGHVPKESMLDLYRSSDVAFVPSNWETFPYACLEPQSQGVPVVASDIPGCQDIVEDGGTGFLFPAGDSGAAVAVLKRLRRLQLDAPHELAKLGRAAVDRVRRQSDRDAVVDALERMLAEVAGRELEAGDRRDEHARGKAS